MQAASCPSQAFRYNGTLCACNPGHVFNLSSNSCVLFGQKELAIVLGSGVSYEFKVPLPETIFSFDSIKKFTQSQAVFLEATLVMLLTWLGFCFLIRLWPLDSESRSRLFKVRWWISRLDLTFATRHWLDDQKPVIKRKTELGGTFSIASWIVFIGLFAALLYQIISKRSVEVHNVRPTNSPDLATFTNDLEFNITTISSMTCAQLRGLGTLVTGSPNFIDHRVVPLSTFANYSCLNTSAGPTITLQCKNCIFLRDFACISWQFVDLPNNPAVAAGFQFNLTAKKQAKKKHLSFVSGILKNISNFDSRPVSFRGAVPNILKFNLFPRIYHNVHDLKLVQPLFHEFVPGSYFDEISQLQASLESSNNGLINTTLYVNFLSAYVVEIDNQNILGPVSFLADLGGLYCISIVFFFYILVQCEYRIKRLRNEDSIMRKIRNRRKAKERWEKLRKYVRYTWAPLSLDDQSSETNDSCCSGVRMQSFRPKRSLSKRKLSSLDAISFCKRSHLPPGKEATQEQVCTLDVRSYPNETESNSEGRRLSYENDKENFRKNVEANEPMGHNHLGNSHRISEYPATSISNLPPLPPFELSDPSEVSMIDLQSNIRNLYEYNVLLREKLLAIQSTAHDLDKDAASTQQSHR